MGRFSFYIRILIILTIPACIALGTYLYMHSAFLAPAKPGSKETVTVEISPGETFKQIATALKEKKLIRYSWSLTLLARFKKTDTKINAGEYELSPSMSPKEILAKLSTGDIVKRQITVKEGSTLVDIAQLVEKAGLATADEFLKGAKDPGLLAKAGISSSSFEGYLFPETYQLSRPITVEEILWRMMLEGEKRWKSEFTLRADELRLSRHEILTLASIIEKESGNAEEQPIVSSVFHNRLNQGMKLQSDPTVIYGLPNFNGNITKDDLQNPHSYNTYVQFGLPPGPICNPGETAIRAALFPAESPYLFFVGDGNGKHVFSSTLQEHNDAVNKYQRGR